MNLREIKTKRGIITITVNEDENCSVVKVEYIADVDTISAHVKFILALEVPHNDEPRICVWQNEREVRVVRPYTEKREPHEYRLKNNESLFLLEKPTELGIIRVYKIDDEIGYKKLGVDVQLIPNDSSQKPFRAKMICDDSANVHVDVFADYNTNEVTHRMYRA